MRAGDARPFSALSVARMETFERWVKALRGGGMHVRQSEIIRMASNGYLSLPLNAIGV
jgi:hypothetical protein